MDDRIEFYRQAISGTLEGWVGDRLPLIIGVIDNAQIDLGIRGDIAEIGVHHGLFTLLLAAVRRGDEAVRAFDIFEDQHLNVDSSGKGVKEIYLGAVARFYPKELAHFHTIQADSLSMRRSTLTDFFPNMVRLFSVDGGHTKAHVVNDLDIAQEVIVPGGVVMLDDFLGPHWPSVTEGFFHFMDSFNRRLSPFLFFQNKLFLTTYSEHKQLSERFRHHLDLVVGNDIHSGLWKYVEIRGFSVLSRA